MEGGVGGVGGWVVVVLELVPPNVFTTGKDFQDSLQMAVKYFIWLLLHMEKTLTQ